MNMKKRAASLAAAGAIAALMLTGCASTPEATVEPSVEACADGLREVKIANIGIYPDAVLILGENQGIFADHCLKLSMQTVPSAPAVVSAVSGGSVDVGYTTNIPFVRGVATGLDLQIVAPAIAINPNARDFPTEKVDSVGVYVPEDSTLAGPLDLEGKTVAIPALGAQGQVQIASDIADAGGDPNKVNWVALDFGTALSQLNAKTIDAATLTTPISVQAIADGNKRLFSPGWTLFPLGTATSVYITSAQTAASKTELLQDFHDAMIEANAYAVDNLDQFREVLSEYTRIPLDQLVEEDFRFYFPSTVTDKEFQAIADRMYELGFLDAELNMSGIVLDLSR